MLGATIILPEIPSHFPIFELINFPSSMIYSKGNVEGRNVIHIWGQYLLSGPSLWGELAVEDQDAASVLCMTLLLVQEMKDPFLSKNIFCSLQTKFPRFDYTFTEIGIVYKKNSGFNNSNSMHMLMYEGSPINRRQCGFVFLHLFRGFN